MTLEDVYKRLLAIQDEVTYDDLPTFEQAIGRLNNAAAWTTGLLETIHADLGDGRAKV